MLLRRSLPLEHETALFIGVSLLDVLATWFLLSGGDFRESNPIAEYILKQWGVGRLIVFKFGLVAFVAVLTQVVAMKRPLAARRLLQFATLVVGGVVVYSMVLVARAQGYF